MTIFDLLKEFDNNKSHVSEALAVNRCTVIKYAKRPEDTLIVKDGEVYSLFTRTGG